MAKRIISTFSRREIKFIASDSQVEHLIADLGENIVVDRYCTDGKKYNIRTMYYDTEDMLFAHRSALSPYYKEKLRLRSYGPPSDDSSQVFVELKKKVDGLCYKRRATLTLSEAEDLILHSRLPDCTDYINRQVSHEILALVKQKPVHAAACISYDRYAFFARNNDDIRLTVDSNILGQYKNPDIRSENFDNILLAEGLNILEIKVPLSIPLYIAEALAKNDIRRGKFSKYIEEYRVLLQAPPRLFIHQDCIAMK